MNNQSVAARAVEAINDTALIKVSKKILNNERISTEDALLLYETAELGLLGVLATAKCNALHKDKVYFNRNFHLEPTNICIYSCAFCSYSRKEGQDGSWDYSLEEMMDIVRRHDSSATEIHIVGGVHPERDVYYFADLIKAVKKARPELHVKAFTAVELDYMFRKAGLSASEGFSVLKEAGLGSIPGGGAEILNDSVRKILCDSKSKSQTWLSIHRQAHLNGVPSNATMLYGHIESFTDRVDHLNQIRNLQDETSGFNAFIPLKFKHKDNFLSHIKELTVNEDLRNYAICRLFLDNISNIKAYWPMTGIQTALISLSFGVNDLDGTIEDSTKIYSMAGADENPSVSAEDMVSLIKNAGRIPVERDSVYNELSQY